MNALLRVLAPLAVLLLTACQATVVDTLPEGADTQCRKAWEGAWIGVDDEDRRDADVGMLVAKDCTITVIELKREGLPRESVLHPQFLGEPDGGFVLFAHSEFSAMAEWKDPDGLKQEGGWWPLKWTRDGAVLKLSQPEHRRIATLIVNGALEGRTYWSGSDSGFNVIRGDAASIRRVLMEERLFDSDDAVRLRRVGDTRRELDRALKKAQRAERR